MNALVRDGLERKDGIVSNCWADAELAVVVGTGPNNLLKSPGILMLSIIPKRLICNPAFAVAPIEGARTGPVIDCRKLTLNGFGVVLGIPAVMFDSLVEYLLKVPIRPVPRDAVTWKLFTPRTEKLPITARPCSCPGRPNNSPMAKNTKFVKLFRFIS
ncbi:MAG: hypothetical protein KAJ46_08935 [Sedimentisphaerales bacterium]|nr:hypothetical protein [Sedimentisphaerales bacterium]